MVCPKENYRHPQPGQKNQPEHLEPIEEIENEEIAPPPSPPSPPAPPPPPSPLWSQQDFIFFTDRIQKQLTELEKTVIGPHIIIIDGIQHLRPHTGQHWKDKIYHLLFETRIPLYWILDCIPNEENVEIKDEGFEDEFHMPNNVSPHRVCMYLLNHHVKAKVFNILNTFLKNEYDNVVYVE